jgi:amino acid transporter
LAFTSVVWTYEGWADGPTIAGETRRPERDVPRGLLLGTLAVVAIYLLANVAYLLVLGLDGLRKTDRAAVAIAQAAFGNRGGAFVTLLVLVSTLGSILGMIIAASRVFFAMGRDRLFFAWVGNVHSRFQTPAAALMGVGLISALYAVVGTFEGIIRYFVFVSGLFFLLIIGSVFLHRRRHPNAARAVRIPLYPLPPILYLAVEVTLLIQLLRENAGPSLVGLGIVLASVPVYLIWERVRSRV